MTTHPILRRWSDFTNISTREVLSLSHLNDFSITVNVGSEESEIHVKIAVSFSDHCFTRERRNGDPYYLNFPNCSRRDGVFCIERYNLSITIRDHIVYFSKGDAWIIDGDNCAILPVVESNGEKCFYAIVFSLEKVKGLPFELHMRVKSAYKCDRGPPAIYGTVKFRRLAQLTLEGKRASRVSAHNRKRPVLK
ncbi:MAG: hypothetical protein ACK4Y5_20245 [Acetobacteraceae bacterium]|jgi:hypothetical protein